MTLKETGHGFPQQKRIVGDRRKVPGKKRMPQNLAALTDVLDSYLREIQENEHPWPENEGPIDKKSPSDLMTTNSLCTKHKYKIFVHILPGCTNSSAVYHTFSWRIMFDLSLKSYILRFVLLICSFIQF